MGVKACQAMADGKTKTETLHKPRDLKTPTHMYPDSQLCVRKTFSPSFVPQPTENHTYENNQVIHTVDY